MNVLENSMLATEFLQFVSLSLSIDMDYFK